jgi:hypothetical protein
MTKKTKADEFDFSDLSEDQLRAAMAGMQILSKRIDGAFKAAKAEYLRTHDADSESEDAVFDGAPSATISVSKDGEGRYEVSDPLAFGDFLVEHHITVGGRPSVITVNYPVPEVTSPAWLSKSIAAHDGAIPDGVAWKPGRRGGVTVKLAGGAESRPFALESFGRVMQRLLPGAPKGTE